MVTRKESMFKSFVWRLMGVFVLGAVTFIYTRQPVITTQITLVHHAVFLIVYYLHERVWQWYRRILNDPFGKWQSVIKSLFYEFVLGMGIGGLIVYLFTDSFPMVTKITGTYTAIKLVMYYFYDQI